MSNFTSDLPPAHTPAPPFDQSDIPPQKTRLSAGLIMTITLLIISNVIFITLFIFCQNQSCAASESVEPTPEEMLAYPFDWDFTETENNDSSDSAPLASDSPTSN